jgi:hypothetical protein
LFIKYRPLNQENAMPSRTQQLQIKHIGYQDNEQNTPQFVVTLGGKKYLPRMPLSQTLIR